MQRIGNKITHALQRSTASQDWLYAIFLSVLAALPRLYRLGLVEFKHDEAKHYRTIYFLTKGAWRWVGAGSSQSILPKPPLFTYILAIPMALSRDPRLATAFLGALAALAAGAFYLVLRRFLGKKASFSAALLFALNPQAILYARKLFTADLLPPLCTLFLAAGVAFLESSRRRIGRWAALTAFTFALLILTTFSPLILLPALALLFWEQRRDLRVSHWLGAIAALSLPFAPYLAVVAPLIPDALTNLGGASSPTDRPPLAAWIWEMLRGSSWPASLLSLEGFIALALAILSLLGLLFLLNEARREKRGKWARFFLAWLCLTPLLTLLVPFEVHPHYLVILYPLLFAVPAAGVELASRRARALGWVALLLLSSIALWQAREWSDILHTATSGAAWYGTPLGYWQRAAERARTLTEQQGAEEALLIMPGDRSWDEKGYILDALLSGEPHRVVDGNTTVVYPPHPALLLIASEVKESIAFALPCTLDLEADLPASPSGGAYHYRLWEPRDVQASSCATGLSPVTAQWASGVRLRGYKVSGKPQPGEVVRVILHWETTQGPLEADVHWFNHLEDREGQRWSQLDLVGWPAKRWRPGDSVMFHFDLPIASEAPPGPYIIRVGQYEYISPEKIENIPVLDIAGNPADYAVALPIPTQ